MAVTPIKALLFLLGLTVAGGATAWVAGVFDARPPVVATEPAPPKVAALPPTAPAEAPAPAAVEPPATAPAQPPAAAAVPPATAEPPATSAEPPATAAQPPAPATAPPAATTEVQPPSFDLVRAEADGSLVIAGHASPNAKVEIVLGSKIIGSAVAGPEGDFAIVIDEPLKPGDYQLVLRSTSPDNVVAMSQETAVVSIPETADGQVLALVEQPGQPAKLITVPEAPKPAEVKPAEPKPEAPAVAAADPAKPAEPPAAATPPADGSQDVASAPAQPEPAPAPAPPPAAAEAPAATQPEITQPAATAKVAVEAVEIEGRKIFVAGMADPGSLLRGYANEILLGETKASEGGRFLIEAERDLPVGDYIIRIDVIGADGVKVIARAAVPFQREPGENLAAVAPPAAAPEPAPTPPPAVAEAPAPAETPTPPPAVAEAPAAAPAPAAPEAPAVAAAEPAPTPAPEPPKVAAEPAAPATTDAPATAEAPAAPAPADVAAAPAAPVEPAPAPAETAPADVATAPAAPAEPAPAPEQPAQVAVAPAPAEAPEVLAPKLLPVDGAVIIRRGDTLWRISKRVYGRGVRYSTIYLANQEQIRDPDRIWPGQVFSVPEKSKEGEDADMKNLGDQAVKVTPYNG